VNLDVGEIVSTKLKEDQEELEEIRKRRTSIIVHGLVESMADNVESRTEEDENRFVDLLHDIKCDDISVNCMYRLGWRHEDPSTNPRPLMVVVASETQKEKVLHQSKNLKFRNMNNRVKIYIHQDLTKKQRERRQMLVKEKKRREALGEADLIIVNNDRLVKRRQRQEQVETHQEQVESHQNQSQMYENSGQEVVLNGQRD
jgi:hypothetical protein